MNTVTQLLQDKRLIWRGSEQKTAIETQTTGFRQMDQELNGGFPKHGVVEITSDLGIGELRLLTPYIKENGKDKLTVFINPPAYLCAEYLAHQGLDLSRVLLIYPENHQKALWAAEQSLKSGTCGSVTLWHPSLEVHQARRLQVASETGQCLHFFFRTEPEEQISLPISLSLQLKPSAQGLEISANKRKGGWLSSTFTLDMSALWPQLTKAAYRPRTTSFPEQKRDMA
ncbi:translesion DNA synthesis-associated protein ImuA [Vibrio sp. JC009]|uniref:translesion DNA synthesis-associated protein ImuA n=1 Tax=Vibrio sp. JC009 TaxID=2912314 RepID=UPI0023AE9773|nr:translesion DNA synthesis-associated protein ImuA [Vibrio sp. JC009]WED22700.1 translesion DNA synthesis-associated protein ImuA [Vibrio sp. JC009]